MQSKTIDFGKTKVSRLFTKQLLPTVLGMIFSAVFITTDGIFVGRGVGSDALAAVNIASPLYIFTTGVGLMFGMGGAILSSINLSKGKYKAASINATQATVVSTIFVALFTIAAISKPYTTLKFLGCPDGLYELAAEYLFWYTLFSVVLALMNSLPFFVRLSKPNVAMWCLIIGTTINIVLDYIFIFIFKWGLFGAAIATAIGESVAVIIMLYYMIKRSPQVKLKRIKLKLKSIKFALKESNRVMQLGVSAFLSEVTIALMLLTGNYVFKNHLGTNGVAAFSIIGYLFPIIFMVFNATIQSAQPIISYNYGLKSKKRVTDTFKLALGTALGFGLLFVLVTFLFGDQIVTLFIANTASDAWVYASEGLPLFSVDYLFFAVNIAVIGFYMSIGSTKRATLFTILRGVMPIICFLLLPRWWGVVGIWVAVGVGEGLTTFVILSTRLRDRILAKRLS